MSDDGPSTGDASGADATPAAAEPPLRSVHTTNLPLILGDTASSVLVTTYQAGKLVVLRNDGGVLNTHFRNFLKPMGLAVSGVKLAVGTAVDILEFHNVSAVCAKWDVKAAKEAAGEAADPPPLQEGDRGGTDGAETVDSGQSSAASTEPPLTQPLPSGERGPSPKHDACFMPRRTHTTGDVQIHEMAWVGDELWFVNTAFSCLATRSDVNSFEPQWRPKFITKLAPGDACHLNGLAMRDGRIRYVTALGETDVAGGWRENKRNGGVLIDVDSSEVIARGLSMPHSPRWYGGRLWLLESGDGSLGYVDLTTGQYNSIAQLPGFTRGLSFLGPLAFVGLSQVRESATFSGIPLVERLEERTCGVWVVHLETGRTVAFVRFEDAVQEIFAVEALAGIRYPDLVNHDFEMIGRSYVLGDAALADVPAELRTG